MKNKLVGWDDGKIYFYNDEGKEFCVNDYKELLEQMVNMCDEYFREKENEAKEDG